MNFIVSFIRLINDIDKKNPDLSGLGVDFIKFLDLV